MQVPPPYAFVGTGKPEKPKRGALLTTLLSILTFGAVLTVSGALLGMTALRGGHANDASPLGAAAPQAAYLVKLLLVVMAIGIAQLVCAVGMWSWKRWGVYGFVGLSLLQFLMSSRVSPDHHFSMSGIVWIALVLVATLPKWGAFED